MVYKHMPLASLQFRMLSARIFVQGIPVDWDENEINARFSLVGALNSVHFVKSSTGAKTGKVVIDFAEQDSADQAIARFDNQAVEGKVCSVKPFINKENRANGDSRNTEGMLARRVYLMNVSYKTSNAEIENFVNEFAPVDQVVIPRDKSGLSRGFAFVYLKDAKDVANCIDYVDGRHLGGRQLRAKSSLVEDGGSDSKR